MTDPISWAYSRPPRAVPNTRMWNASVGSHMVTGHDNLVAMLEYDGNHPEPWRSVWEQIGKSTVAVDIEAAGLAHASFDMRCITLSWYTGTGSEAMTVLIDPRDPHEASFARRILTTAPVLVFHNGAYDVPPLVQHGVMTLDHIVKVWDTNVLARMAYPDKDTSKGLESLAGRSDTLGMPPSPGSIKNSYLLAGYKKSDGFMHADIDMLPYRIGAMSDTPITLRMLDKLYNNCVQWLTSSTFEGETVPRTAQDAHRLIEREQITNRAMLRRSAIGLRVDREYLHTYREQTLAEREHAANLIEKTIAREAVGNGLHVVNYLDTQGLIPASWPRTPTGRLKADKQAFESLDHPLIDAHRKVADTDHILDYLGKTDAMAQITGRVHPQVGILGASATGRMAYSQPELQQFPSEARKIILWDKPEGAVSIDWSSVEPVIMANCARDTEFLAGFNHHGADLYEPITSQGIERKTAKVVMLAAMYGQGSRSLAERLGVSVDEAKSLRKKVFEPMPRTDAFMKAIQATSEQHGRIMTADGRMLTIPTDPTGSPMAYKGVNYFCQGSAYSVMSEVINRAYGEGISDGIYLAMHDELVVDASIAERIRELMQVPPAWLLSWTGHDNPPVLRTDANPLPDHWLYV